MKITAKEKRMIMARRKKPLKNKRIRRAPRTLKDNMIIAEVVDDIEEDFDEDVDTPEEIKEEAIEDATFEVKQLMEYITEDESSIESSLTDLEDAINRLGDVTVSRIFRSFKDNITSSMYELRQLNTALENVE